MKKDEIINGFIAAHCGSVPSDCIIYVRELLSVCLIAFDYSEAIRELYAICWTSDLKSLFDRVAFLRSLLEK